MGRSATFVGEETVCYGCGKRAAVMAFEQTGEGVFAFLVEMTFPSPELGDRAAVVHARDDCARAAADKLFGDG